MNEYVEQLLDIATRCRQESDFVTAIDCYQKVLSLKPNTSSIYLDLGKTFEAQQDFNRAISAYYQTINLEPKQLPEVYDALASLLIKQAKFDSAIAVYLNLIELYPLCASEYYVKIGDTYYQKDQFFLAKSFWQKAAWERALYNINEVIDCIHNYFATDGKLLDLDILDNGCDPTGKQLALLAEQTKGRVVGTNIYSGFPEGTVQRHRSNNEFYRMDGQNLTFDDCSFNLVISLNVLEHVPNPEKYLRECYRVLRFGGVGFFSWYPIWSGATGHHVHPDMVSNMARRLNIPPPYYSLDGNSIPWWGHLLFSPAEMLSFLIEEKRYNPNLAQWMTDYIYHGKDLNRYFWQDVKQLFHQINWQIVEEKYRHKKLANCYLKEQLARKYIDTNLLEICGATIVVRK